MTTKKNPAAVSLGALGGRSTSEAKKAAVRENGKKGGRPKKASEGTEKERAETVDTLLKIAGSIARKP